MTTTMSGQKINLQTNPKRKRSDSIARWMFRGAALMTLLVTTAIIFTLVIDAVDYIIKLSQSDNGLGALLQIGWYPRRGMFDIPTLLIGTAMVTVIAMVVAVPLGLGAAIYLAEYASPKVRKTIKPVLEMLAGIPSVVLGYFAISFINPNIVNKLVPSSGNYAFTLAAAGIGVGILTVPIIASVAEDSLRSVPMSLREASYGLGAERLQTTFRVVFPAAISGIVAALILGISRAIGETMVVAIAAGAVGGGLRIWEPFQPGQTMTAAMASLGFGSDMVAGDNLAFQSLYFVGLLLFIITLLLNVASDWLVNRVREEY